MFVHFFLSQYTVQEDSWSVKPIENPVWDEEDEID